MHRYLGRRATLLAALAFGVVGAAACSSVTSGSAHLRSSAAPQPSAPDFPSGSIAVTVPAPSESAPAAPSTSSTTTSAPAGPSNSAVTPAPDAPLKTITVHGTERTFTVQVWARESGKNCAAHAYGAPVIKYLGAHPCASMTRLLATTTVAGRAVAFAQESVTFGGTSPQVYAYAGKFRALVSKDGTGNVNDLLREGYRLPSGPTSVPYPNAFSALAQDAVTTVVEAWYVQGETPQNDPALVRMEKDCFLQVY